MKYLITYILCVVSGVFVYIAEGIGFSYFLLWNLTPILLAVWFTYVVHQAKASLLGVYGYFFGSFLFWGFGHISWFLDSNGFKTGSSTSGLIFLVLPIYSFVSGGLGLLLASLLMRNKKT